MFKRAMIPLLVFLLLLSASAGVAQIVTTPDEGVRGSGAIMTSMNTVGAFDVNVGRSGNVIFGGFKYQEVTSTNTRGNTIVSKFVTGLTVSGNMAKVTAVGYWNGMLSDLTIEALDDLDMDWFHITAKPRGPLLIIYDQSGGLIKGDLVVYSKPLPVAYVKGEGTIDVGRNVGKFALSARKQGSLVSGTISYREFSPYVMSPIIRPKVTIYVPQVTKMDVTGTTAVLAGKGTFNGKPAMVEVKVRDTSMLDVLLPDEFYITATPISTDSFSNARYSAGGPLTSGDIVVFVPVTVP